MWCHSLSWFQALTINQWFWNLFTQITTMSSRLTYGFLTGQLCFDLQVPQTLKDWKRIYISSKFTLQYSPLWSCSHSATQARNTRLICQPPPRTLGLTTTPRKYSTGRFPPLCSFWCQGSGHPSGLDDALTSGSASSILNPVLPQPAEESCQHAQLTVPLWGTKPLLVPNACGIPRQLPDVAHQASAYFSSLLCPSPAPQSTCSATRSHVTSHHPQCRVWTPCRYLHGFFFPLSFLSFSPVSPSQPSPFTLCIWLNSFSPTKVQFRGHLLQVAANPSLAGHGTLALRSDDILYLPLRVTYCVITMTFMASSPLRGYKLQRGEIIFSISFYLSYLASHTDLFHLCFPRKLKKIVLKKDLNCW